MLAEQSIPNALSGFGLPARPLLAIVMVAGLLALELLAGCSSTPPTQEAPSVPRRSVPSAWQNQTASQTIAVDHFPCISTCATSGYSHKIVADGKAITVLRVRLTWTGNPPCDEMMVDVNEIGGPDGGRRVAVYHGKQPLVFELSNMTLLEESGRAVTRLGVSAGHASWSSKPVIALEVNYTVEWAALIHPVQAEDYSAANRTATGPNQGIMRC